MSDVVPVLGSCTGAWGLNFNAVMMSSTSWCSFCGITPQASPASYVRFESAMENPMCIVSLLDTSRVSGCLSTSGARNGLSRVYTGPSPLLDGSVGPELGKEVAAEPEGSFLTGRVAPIDYRRE